MTEQMQRQPHASLNERSRLKKAMKVERLLSSVCALSGAKVLEIGTGSGFIAAHFASVTGPGGSVHAVDVVDQRRIHEGYQFQLVPDTALPYQDASFDICISNHVIEHVGDRAAQARHLREIRRVLRPNGWLYLAVPNRWALVEPHFRLPFLSWLPRRLRDSYVRIAGRGDGYDCDPPGHSEIAALLAEAGYRATDVSINGIKGRRRIRIRSRAASNPFQQCANLGLPVKADLPILPVPRAGKLIATLP